MRYSLNSIFFVSTLILLASCSTSEPVERKHFSTFTVGSGSIQQTESVLATVEGKNTAELAFKVLGRIASIAIEPGQSVKKGQILATLGNEEANTSVVGLDSVLASLQNMGLSIDSMNTDTKSVRDAIESLYDERIADIENETKKAALGTSIASRDLDLARSNLSNSIAIFSGSTLSDAERVTQAEKNLTSAKNSLENTKSLLVQQEDAINKNALSSMSAAFITARDARDYADEVLGVTEGNRSKNDAYEAFLGAKNTATKTDAETSFRAFNTEYETMYQWYYSNIVGKDSLSGAVVRDALDKSLTVLTSERELLHRVATMLENSISSSSFSTDALNALKDKDSTLLANLESAILTTTGGGVKGSINAFDSLAATRSLQIGQLEDAVKIAEESLALAKSGKDTAGSEVRKNLENLKTAVGMKSDALDLARVSEDQVVKNKATLIAERTAKIREAEAKVAEIVSKKWELGARSAEVRMNRNLSLVNAENGIIRAPFDGIILKKYFEAGTVVSAGMPVFSLSSTDGAKIRTNYDSTYALKKDDLLTTRTPMNGSGFVARITVLNPHPDTLHNKSYLEADLVKYPGIVGDRVTVEFSKTIESDGANLVIPTKALITRYGTPGVYTIENGHAKFTLVDLVRSDESFALVSGLRAGQKIITDGKENMIDGEGVE